MRGQAQPANLAAVIPANEHLAGLAKQLTELGGFDRLALMPSPKEYNSLGRGPRHDLCQDRAPRPIAAQVQTKRHLAARRADCLGTGEDVRNLLSLPW